MSQCNMEQLTICGVEPIPPKVKRFTRGDYYGIKATALARDAKVKLSKIRVNLDRLQEPWAEADPMIEQAVERAVEAIDALVKQFTDSAEYMNEAMDE